MEDTIVIITVILLIIITFITIGLQIFNYTGWSNRLFVNNKEEFQACYSSNGNMSMRKNICGKYENMTNNGRLAKNNRGPIKNFHQCFTNGEIPELLWRKQMETNINNTTNVDGLNGVMLQPNNDVINNVYNHVDY